MPTKEEKQSNAALKLSKAQKAASLSKAQPQYTDDEIAQVTAAAVAKLKAGKEISDDDARAVLAGHHQVAEALAHTIGTATELLDAAKKAVQEKWKVKPKLEPMSASPPESGIGKRIAYCRGQLDNLPIEALARYTKNFDEVGVSRASLVRYEAGGTMPGARELRILCNALWVTPGWLLTGEVGTAGLSANEFDLISALGRMIRQGSGGTKGLDDDFEERAEAKEVEKRQKWIDEARKPQPRG